MPFSGKIPELIIEVWGPRIPAQFVFFPWKVTREQIVSGGFCFFLYLSSKGQRKDVTKAPLEIGDIFSLAPRALLAFLQLLFPLLWF